MQSRVCKIEKGVKDLDAILSESERVALLNNLTKKQTLQLRLICEELDGMLPNIISDFDGDFWIEFENNVCKVNADITFAEYTAEKKKELVNLAKNKENAFAKGIVGKIRSALENYFLDKEVKNAWNMAGLFHYANEMSVGIAPSSMWSLKQYKDLVKKEAQEDWDELEKSIIANLADDVIVGVKGRRANIVIIKEF